MPRGPRINNPDQVPVFTSYVDKRKGKEVWKRVYVDREKAHLFRQTPPPGWKPFKGNEAYRADRAAKGSVAPEAEKPHPEDPNRMHSHHGAQQPHKVSEKHTDEESDSEHRNEQEKYHREFHGDYGKFWADKLNVKHYPDRRVKMGSSVYDADVYHHPQTGYAYSVNSGVNFKLVVPSLHINRSFDRQKDAQEQVKHIYEQNVAKSFILKSIENLISKAKDLESMAMYQAGDDKLVLQNDQSHYVVMMNGSKVADTDDFQYALKIYYRNLANMIKNDVSDFDQALDNFGDKVVLNNREALKKLAMLGHMGESKMLKSFDYTSVEYFFKKSSTQECMSVDLFKYAPPSAIIHNLPMQEEMGHGAAEGGRLPRRQNLKDEEYHAKKRSNTEQKAIEESPSKNISPVSIMRSIEAFMLKAQAQRITPFPEEDKRHSEPPKVMSKGSNVDTSGDGFNPLLQSIEGASGLRNGETNGSIYMKDFEKETEAEAFETVGTSNDKNKIGDKQEAITKAAYSLHAPQKENVIESKGDEQGISKGREKAYLKKYD